MWPLRRDRAIMLGSGRHAEMLKRYAETWKGVRIVANVTKDNMQCSYRWTMEGVRYFINGVGGVGDNHARERAWQFAIQDHLLPLSIVHPLATRFISWTNDDGLIILAHAHIGYDVKIGKNVLVNTGAIIEHDCAIGDHVHIAPGAILCGNVTIGEGAHIGAGAVIRQGIRIGAWSVVGCGAVVVKDVPDGVTVVGNPARPIKRKDGVCYRCL